MEKETQGYNPTDSDQEEASLCSFRLHATGDFDGAFTVKGFELRHTCSQDNNGERSRVGSKWVSHAVFEKAKYNLKYEVKQIIRDIRQVYGKKIKYHLAYAAKKHCKEMIFGKSAESYARISKWVSDFGEANGVYVIYRSANERFHSLFVSFKSAILVFKQSRPILCIDACHLKWI